MRKIALAVLVLLFSTLCARADGFLFNNGSFTALQDPHFPSMTPSSINNKGTIVGGSFAGAFIDENGVITALNVPTPTGINDFGEIVGYGIPFLPGIGSQSSLTSTATSKPSSLLVLTWTELMDLQRPSV